MFDSETRNIIFIEGPKNILNEVKHILSTIDPELDYSIVEETFTDTVKIFNGEYPGYQACNTKYHDLAHTIAVFLATARLIHGVFLTGKSINKRTIVLGLISALFHDTGFIQTEDDTEGTGAKYTIGHEERSIEFTKNYLTDKGYKKDDINDCSHIILCTILKISPGDVQFRTNETELLGKIVGTADLLAQISDRIYLEKLLYLYEEFEEAGIPGFDSELELLKRTETFYEDLSKKRMDEELGGVSTLMRIHFKNRWGIDKDLYQVYINKNIEYLKSVLEIHEDSYRQMLRRGGIVKRFQEYNE